MMSWFAIAAIVTVTVTVVAVGILLYTAPARDEDGQPLDRREQP